MANPPITVGELTDVPAPLSPVNAQFHQEVANRIVHRFASASAMNAWAAAPGSLAFAADTNALYLRYGGAWWQVASQGALNGTTAAANASAQGMIARTQTAALVTISTTGADIAAVGWTADPSRWYRIVVDVPRIVSGAVPQQVNIITRDTSNNDQRIGIAFMGVAGDMGAVRHDVIVSGLAGTQNWKIRAATNTGTATIPASAFNASSAMISVEDCGAV